MEKNLTKNVLGMNKTFRHRTETISEGKKSCNHMWMIQNHSLDRITWLHFLRKDWLLSIKKCPDRKNYLLTKYKEVIKMWI